MKRYQFDVEKYKDEIVLIVEELMDQTVEGDIGKYSLPVKTVDRILKRHPKDSNKLFSKDELIQGIEWMMKHKPESDNGHCRLRALQQSLKMKPTRTVSGVTTVTVLTKPWMCPGKCIFCPNDVRMPKSYIANEPGAQRALANRFSPYLQVHNRLKALRNIGHPTDKIELLVLGGTWSVYPEKYQVWFIKECFRAMNEFQDERGMRNEVTGSLNPMSAHEMKEYLKTDFNKTLRNDVGDMEYNKLIATEAYKKEFEVKYVVGEETPLAPLTKRQETPLTPLTKRHETLLAPLAKRGIANVKELWERLENEHKKNSVGNTRCVGLVLETRPDSITPKEVLRMRKLGATKVQLGIQTLDDMVSDLNKRGEHRVETARSFALLRAGGFKIHAHMMPNLFGATPEIDKTVYEDLFTLEDYKPDEVKIYPTSIIKDTGLSDLYERGEFKPYETETLIDLITYMMEHTPEYCRITRVIRDIPSTEIEAGNKTTNLRQIVEHRLASEGRQNPNIRAREIQKKNVTLNDLHLDIIEYDTSVSKEYFMQYITDKREIAGFLRLSLPMEAVNSKQISVTDPSITLPHASNLTPRSSNPITSELNDCAIIREVHVYGPSLELQRDSRGEAQHLGLGSKLIEKAKELARQANFEKLAVISSIGTREYYAKRGFVLHELYQIAELTA